MILQCICIPKFSNAAGIFFFLNMRMERIFVQHCVDSVLACLGYKAEDEDPLPQMYISI